MSIIDQSAIKPVDVDNGVRNKWRWDWLKKSVLVDPLKKFPKAKLNWSNRPVTMMAKDHIRKTGKPGKAVCVVCDGDLITYSEGGLGTIKDHLETLKHFRCVTALAKNQLLPGTTTGIRETMYGAPPTYYNDKGALSTTASSPFKPSVHMLDRIANMEAMLVAFITEHSLSLSLSESLIELAKELSKDEAALKRLHMHRTTASYKLTYGLGLTWQNELTNILRETPFLLNMDESTSSNNKHVYTILVSFYNPKVENIVVEHLGSINVPPCTSEYLYRETLKIFSTREIPLEKLIAMLADSASTMRGSVSGLETKLQTTVAPHLIDINGESCQHMHNIVKKLTSCFNYFLKNLFRDVSTEFKFSPDCLDLLQQCTFHLGMKFRKPVNYISCRWLSVYDTSTEFNHAHDVYKLIACYFEKADVEIKLKKKEKEITKASRKQNKGAPQLEKLVKEKESSLRKESAHQRKEDKLIKGNNVTDASKEALCELQQRFIEKFKSSTEKGKEKKQIIISKLLHNQTRYVLFTSFYHSVPPIFKSYVMMFQGDSPLIHKVYYQQVNLVKEFYSYFVKPSVVAKCKKGKRLLKLDLSEKNLFPK